MTTIDAMSDEIMKGLTEYADLADTAMKKTVRKTAKSVKDEISANAPKRTGAYSKSWTAKKTKENSHSLEMTVHSKNRYQLAHLLEKGHAKRGGDFVFHLCGRFPDSLFHGGICKVCILLQALHNFLCKIVNTGHFALPFWLLQQVSDNPCADNPV